MRVDGVKRVQRKLKDLPKAERKYVSKAVKRSTDEGERVSTSLAPDVTHETKGNIYSEIRDEGMTGIVFAIRNDAPQEDKDRAYSIEHGRKKGIRGTTFGYHHMHRTRQYLGKKHRDRLKRAIRKAVKEAFRA